MTTHRILLGVSLSFLACGPAPQPETDAADPLDAGEPSVCTTGEVIAAYTGDACTETTRACLRDCTDPDPSAAEACTNACLDADPSCQRCIPTVIAGCFNERCQQEWDVFACCSERECDPSLEGAFRATCRFGEGRCIEEYDAYGRCIADRELQAECGARVDSVCQP